MPEKYKVLLIFPGAMPPKAEATSNLEYHISRYCYGDTISTHWGSRADLPRAPLSEIYGNLGSFVYHATFSSGLPKLFKFAWNLCYFTWEGLRLSITKGRYQAIVTYGPFTCGMAGFVIRTLTGSRVIMMIPADPINTFKFVNTTLGAIKYRFARAFVPRFIRAADAVWMLYPSQLDDLPGGKPDRVHVFPDFTPTTEIAARDDSVDEQSARYVLFLGHPFHRKGVDLLIGAFRKIAERHPRVVLRIVGHCPDLAPYRALAGGEPRVVFERPVLHHEAMRLLAGCHLFVLPSRLEGVPRTVVEAMAMGRPVVASRVDGTPSILEDGRDGLLFEPEDVDDLAEKMDRVLGDDQLASRLGAAARARVERDLSSGMFAVRFRDMIARVVGGQGPGHP